MSDPAASAGRDKTHLLADRVQGWRAEGQSILRALHEEAQRHYRVLQDLEGLAGDVAADLHQMPDNIGDQLRGRNGHP